MEMKKLINDIYNATIVVALYKICKWVFTVTDREYGEYKIRHRLNARRLQIELDRQHNTNYSGWF